MAYHIARSFEVNSFFPANVHIGKTLFQVLVVVVGLRLKKFDLLLQIKDGFLELENFSTSSRPVGPLIANVSRQ